MRRNARLCSGACPSGRAGPSGRSPLLRGGIIAIPCPLSGAGLPHGVSQRGLPSALSSRLSGGLPLIFCFPPRPSNAPAAPTRGQAAGVFYHASGGRARSFASASAFRRAASAGGVGFVGRYCATISGRCDPLVRGRAEAGGDGEAVSASAAAVWDAAADAVEDEGAGGVAGADGRFAMLLPSFAISLPSSAIGLLSQAAGLSVSQRRCAPLRPAACRSR